MATTRLRNREVTRRYVATREEPKAFDDVWAEMRKEFPDTHVKKILPVNDVKQRLTDVLLENEGDNTFHQDLFEAVREYFGSYVLNEDNDEGADEDESEDEGYKKIRYIVLEQIGDYAMGFARGVDCTYGLVPNYAKETSSCGLQAGCKLDHGSCLLVKQGKHWTATDIFSVVELKTSWNDDDVMDLNSTHGALGQAILYTLGGVLLYHARNGVLSFAEEQVEAVSATEEMQRKVPEKALPLAVIAMLSDETEKLRWVYGDLLIPEACGNKVEYCVKGSGKFSNVANEEEESIVPALSVYVDTLLFGIRTARRVLRDRVGKPYRPDPMTGMKLMIGERHLKFSILASPIPMPEHAAVRPNQGDQAMVVSQAELFFGNLNVHETLTKSGLGRASYVQFDATKLLVPVLIKVSSRAVHRLLVNPSIAFSTIKVAHEVLDSRRVQGHTAHNQTAKRRRMNAQAVAGPLLAAVKTDVGMITIMTDLSKEGYELLRPQHYSQGLTPLWKGFKDLVAGVLLPLAHQDYSVVHSDIRAGFDFTTNILFKQVDGESVRMELVDFESLVSLADWAAPGTHVGYIQKVTGWVATTFVWWQCIFVAFAWLEERNVVRTNERRINSAVANNTANDRNSADMNLLRGRISELAWMPASVQKHATELKIDAKSVLATLAALDNVFSKRDEYRKSMKREDTLVALASYLKDKEQPKQSALS